MELEHLNEGKSYQNKTRLYLNRILRENGKPFLERLRKMFFVASGIGDQRFEEMSGLSLDSHLFLLFRITDDIDSFMDNLIWMREHESYETDYAFDLERGLHMIVFKLREPYETTVFHFKRGEYSKLYPTNNLTTLFSLGEKNSLVYRVTSKSAKRKMELESLIGRELPDEAELDSRPMLKDETFNWSPKGEHDEQS